MRKETTAAAATLRPLFFSRRRPRRVFPSTVPRRSHTTNSMAPSANPAYSTGQKVEFRAPGSTPDANNLQVGNIRRVIRESEAPGSIREAATQDSSTPKYDIENEKTGEVLNGVKEEAIHRAI